MPIALTQAHAESDDGVLTEILKRVRALDPLEQVTRRQFEEAVVEFIDVHAATLRSLSTIRGRFRKIAPYFAGRMVHDITPGAVQDMIADRLKQGLTPATAMRDRAQMSRFLSWCVERKYAVSNPVSRVPKMREDNGRTRWLTVEEVGRLTREAERSRSGMLAPLLFTALHTGARMGELLKLEWRSVDLVAMAITFVGETTKDQRSRVVPMVPALVEVLKDWRAAQRACDGPCVNVFTHRGRSVRGIKTAFNHACRRARIVDFRWHDLRHCFSSFFMMNGGDLYRLQSLLGHASPKTTARYAHLSAKFMNESRSHIGIPGRAGKVAPPAAEEMQEPPVLPGPAAPLPSVPAETAELLREVRTMIQASRGRYVTTHEILTRLAGSPRWTILRGAPTSAGRIVAALLRPAGVKASQVGGWGGVNVRGYALAKLAPAFERYLDNQEPRGASLDSAGAQLESVLAAIEEKVAAARRRLEGIGDAVEPSETEKPKAIAS